MMSRDEWVYTTLLVVSVTFGFIFKNIHGHHTKRIVAGIVGIFMVVAVCGWHTFHSVVTILVNIIIVKTSKKHCQIFSFIWCFSYLLFFRTTHFLGLPKVPAVSNAVQLLLTLKMVGLAFEISDSYSLTKQLKEDPKNPELQLRVKYETVNPTILDIWTYGYCYIGLLTGPYFKFRTYFDMLHLDSRNIEIMPKFLEQVKWGLMSTVVFLTTSKFYWIDYAATEEFYSRSFLYRIWFMAVMFLWFRARMYAAWIISECVCITACLGAYPAASKPRCGKGPTDLAVLENLDENLKIYNFETVHNIDVYGCELNPTVRGSMRAWNMSVQYWLATYIYKRVPWKTFRTSITMVVSAYWHGIHPGYYLSFMTIPLSTMGEDLCAKSFRQRLSTNGQKIYDVVRWIFRVRELDYMCMGFLLLGFDRTIRFWSSIYYLMHISIFFWIIVGLIGSKLVPRKKDV